MRLIDSSLLGKTRAALPSPTRAAVVLVFGVGNVRMGDGGVGIHAIRRLKKEPAIAGVRLLDTSAGRANLPTKLDDVHAVILIAAMRDGRCPGTISYLNPQRMGDLPPSLEVHNFSLRDLFNGRLPQFHLYAVSVSAIRSLCNELSDAVSAAVPPLAWTVHGHAVRLAANTARPASRHTARTARTLPTDAQPEGR